MSSRLIRNLKTLFHDYIYYRTDDETNFHDWITENVTYTDGEFVNKSIMEQELTVTFEAWSIAPGYRTGNLKCQLTNGVAGQTVTIEYVRTSDGEISTSTITTNSNGYCYLQERFFRNYTATITANPITINGVTYTGDTATYDL